MKKFRWLKCIPYSGTCSGIVYANSFEEAKKEVCIVSETTDIPDNWTLKDYGSTIKHKKEGWRGKFIFVSLIIYEMKEKKKR